MATRYAVKMYFQDSLTTWQQLNKQYHPDFAFSKYSLYWNTGSGYKTNSCINALGNAAFVSSARKFYVGEGNPEQAQNATRAGTLASALIGVKGGIVDPSGNYYSCFPNAFTVTEGSSFNEYSRSATVNNSSWGTVGGGSLTQGASASWKYCSSSGITMPTDGDITTSSTVSASTRNNSSFIGFWYNGTRQSTSSSWSNTNKYDMSGIVAVFGLQFKIAFDANGGTGTMSTKTCYYGVEDYQPQGKITANAFTRASFIFAGWNTKADGTGVAISATESVVSVYSKCAPATKGTVTLYAQWTSNTYRIAFNGNGNTGGSTAAMTRTIGELPFNLTANGFTRAFAVTFNYNGSGQANGSATATSSFAGWNTKADGTGTNYSNQQSITSNLASLGQTFNLYAKWTAGSVTLPNPTTIPTGKGFDGWYSSSALTTKVGNAGATYTPTGAITLYAKWGNTKFIVRYNANGGTGSMADHEFTYGYSQNLKANAFSRNGYTFAGWATSATGAKVYNNEQSVSNLSGVNNAVVNLYAKWDPIKSTTTLNNNGGSGVSPTSVTTTYDSAMPAITTAPTRTGYAFTGFFTATSGGTKYYNADKSSAKNCDYVANTTLYAQWSANSYSVAFNGNGSTGGSMSTETGFKYGTAKALTSNAFTKTGHSFAGWATSASGAVAYANGASVTNLTATNNATVTLYAKWSPMVYSVTLNKNGGTCTDLTSYTYGVGATLPTPTKAGYTFNGWYTNSSFTGDPVTKISTTDTGTKTFYAKFTANTYTVTVAPNGGTGGSCPSYTTSASSQTKTVTHPTKTGYTLTGYTITGASGGTPSVSGTTLTIPANVYGNITLTAKWAANSYTLRHNKNDGTATNVDKAMTYDVESQIMWISSELGWSRTGYTFKGWATSASGAVVYENGAKVKNLTTVANAVFNIYAIWQINQYKITLTADGGHGTVTGGGTYNYGTQVQIKATPAAGYNFTQWSDGNTSATRTITLGAANVSLTAQFSAHPVNVSAISSPTAGGVSSVNNTPGGGSFETGSTVTLRATPNTGYNFTKWSDNGAQEHTVVVDGDPSKNVYTATYTLKQFDIKLSRAVKDGDTFPSPSTNDCGTVQIDSGTAGNTAQLLAVNYGTQHTIKAIAKTGWAFDQWSDGNTTANRTITISGAVTLSAVFKRRTYAVTVSVASGTSGQVRAASSMAWAATSTTNVKYEASTVIDANPTSGWQFKRWSDLNTTKQRTVTIPTANPAAVTLEAEFERRKFRITVNVASIDADKFPDKDNDHVGKVSIRDGAFGYTATGEFYFEESVLLHTQTVFGWEFDHWSEGGGSVSIPDHDITVTAYFRRVKFRLTVNTAPIAADVFDYDPTTSYYDHASDNTPGGAMIDGETPGSTVYKDVKYEASAEVEVDQAQGWAVDHWGDTEFSGDAKTIEITNTTNLTIHMKRMEFVVSVSANPAAGGNAYIDSASSKSLRYGEQDTISAIAKIDYAFDGWLDDTERAHYDRIITCKGTMNYEAKFRYIVHSVNFSRSPSADYGNIDIIINDVASEAQRNPANAIQVREGQKITVRTVPGRIYDAEQVLCYDGPNRATANLVWAANLETNTHSFYLTEGYKPNFSIVVTFREKPVYELRIRANDASLGSVELTSDYGKATFEKWSSVVDGLIRINAYKGITYNVVAVFDNQTVDFEQWTDEDGASEGVTTEKYSFVVGIDEEITEKGLVAQLVSRRRQITFGNGSGSVAGRVQCFYENGTEIESPCDVLYGQYLRIVAKPEMEYLFNYFRAVNTNVPIGGQTLPTDPIEKDDFIFQITKQFGMQFSLTAFFAEKDPFFILLTKNINGYGVIKLRYAENAAKNWSEINNQISLGETNPAHVGITFIATAEIVPHTSLAGNEKVRFIGWYNAGTEIKLTDAPSYEFSSTTARVLLEYEARFEDIPLYGVTIQQDGLGTVTVESDCDVNDPDKFLQGRTVTLRAEPNSEEGYELSRWYNQTTGAVVPSTPGEKPSELYTISNIDRDMTILAEFKRIKLNHITYGVHPATSEVSAVSEVSYRNAETGDQVFYWGDTVVLTAKLADPTNYPFGGFYLDGMKLDIPVTTSGNVVTGSYRMTRDYCDIKVKCSAKVTVAETHTTGASGSVSIDGEGTSKFVALGDTCNILASVSAGMFNGWYLSTDVQHENVLEYGASAEYRVVGTASLVARFVTEADFVYIALFNEFMNSSEADNSIVLGELSMTNGTQITEAEYNQAMFGSSVLVTGAYAYYKFAGACNSQITAVAKTQRGFHNWVRKTVTSSGIGPATEFAGANIQNPAVVTNKHYAFYCYWGDAQPVHVYVGFVSGSSSAVGAVRFSADSEITEYDDSQGVAVGYVAQGSSVTVNANVKNGYRFVGWYLEEAGTSQMLSEDQEYTFTLSDTTCLYAKIAEDANAIYAWDASANAKDMEWKSKVFVSNRPFDPAVIRVDADGYDRPLQVGVDLYSSPDTNDGPTVRKEIEIHNQTMRRLESARPERFMQVTIKNNKPVNAVFVGTSSTGITQ